MANMSYCRFQNTANDLHDCVDALLEEEQLSDDDKMSDDEKEAAQRMRVLCEEYIDNYDATLGKS
jgi:hypothetical protein